ncbi:hypothetical protein EJ07DRAFT_158967 [Lizonia empirigonia]|nr:hypothetical protein EJ07DRAFT_158967 [Lizonia empirigonia]
MARRLTQIQQSSWHAANCKLCGGKIAQEKVGSYRAIRTLPDQEQLEDEVPALEDSRLGRIRIGTFMSLSRIRSLGTLPGLYLFHRRCYAIIRHVADCDRPKVSLLTLVSVLAPTTPIDESDVEPLSKLDGDTLATIFNRLPSIQPDNGVPSQFSGFRELLHNTPPELLSIILSKCTAEHALAVTVGLADSFFDNVVRDNLARQRIAIGIQVARLLQNQAHNEVYTEREIKLSSSMTAVFVPLPGGLYLQVIEERKSHQKSLAHCIDFSLDAEPKVLALQVDHLGIRNIAFELDKDEIPMWLRDENRSANVFVDRLATGSFSCLRIVSDVSTALYLESSSKLTSKAYQNPHDRHSHSRSQQ